MEDKCVQKSFLELNRVWNKGVKRRREREKKYTQMDVRRPVVANVAI